MAFDRVYFPSLGCEGELLATNGGEAARQVLVPNQDTVLPVHLYIWFPRRYTVLVSGPVAQNFTPRPPAAPLAYCSRLAGSDWPNRAPLRPLNQPSSQAGTIPVLMPR